ncbi:flagellar protein FlgN [Thermaerobacillus caldiproteolyticus]|uniref:flagellar protein FlgN n=1 Tax=Thermaerobacillus caldiproteolyticus TaxID=247480 RepID=UPI00188A9A63|nr:flagellar protein FlgN [Anoxybacillus caldiproteolyticus]QPA30717.1 flagellar protein FlgN [Anoxybacillus caldiproteolyticus]
MSAKPLIDLLEGLLKLHKGLLQLANKKTESLKKGDIEALTAIMKEEQKYIAAVKQIEKERILAVEKILSSLGHTQTEPTLTTCIELMEEPERSALEILRDKLLAVVAELRNINQLNQQLLQQSLQFVNMTLDMIMPKPQEVNYRKPNMAPSSYEGSRSLFDSKA